MLEVSKIRAALFAKDLNRMTTFYRDALGLTQGTKDEYQAVLQSLDFELVIHQVPQHIADTIEIAEPPVRREDSAIRLDYPVADVRKSRQIAKTLGGDIDESPPPWAEPSTNYYLGCDPEGNVFGVSQQ